MTDDLKRALDTLKSERGRHLIELMDKRTCEKLQEIATLQGVIAAIEAEIEHVKATAQHNNLNI